MGSNANLATNYPETNKKKQNKTPPSPKKTLTLQGEKHEDMDTPKIC